MDGVREAAEAVDTSDKDVFHPSTLQVADDAQPEVGAFPTVTDPVAQHITVALQVHAQDRVECSVPDLALPPQLHV